MLQPTGVMPTSHRPACCRHTVSLASWLTTLKRWDILCVPRDALSGAALIVCGSELGEQQLHLVRRGPVEQHPARCDASATLQSSCRCKSSCIKPASPACRVSHSLRTSSASFATCLCSLTNTKRPTVTPPRLDLHHDGKEANTTTRLRVSERASANGRRQQHKAAPPPPAGTRSPPVVSPPAVCARSCLAALHRSAPTSSHQARNHEQSNQQQAFCVVYMCSNHQQPRRTTLNSTSQCFTICFHQRIQPGVEHLFWWCSDLHLPPQPKQKQKRVHRPPCGGVLFVCL